MPTKKHFIPLPHSAKGPAFLSLKSEGGFATLTSVLLAGSIASAVAVTLLLSGVGSTQNTIVTTQSAQAIALAQACAEKAMQTLHDNIEFTGSGGFSLGEGSCTFTVTAGAGQQRTITASGVVETVTRKMKVEITALTPKIIVTSWQDVGDF